ncbi:MAG: hypothetical protein KAS96_02040 [Planctomycetes bacterium]|nr:hypothetical protein [Planctomycetota bacterium]
MEVKIKKSFMMKSVFSCILMTLAIVILWLLFYKPDYAKTFQEIANPKAEMSVNDFLENSKKMHFEKIEVYYIPLSVDRNAPLKEEELIHGPCLKTTSNIIACTAAPYSSDFTKAFTDFTNKKQDEIAIDFRFCCVVHKNTQKIIRFSIALSSFYSKTIYINGVPYEASDGLINSFLKLLPIAHYEEAIKYIKNAV